LIERAQIMTTLTCPLGHTDDINTFRRPASNVTGGSPVYLNSVFICPECRVLFRRKSITEEAMQVRKTINRAYNTESDGT
jgi:hypothetical protein